MKQGSGKGKGSSFEREICKKLSLWMTSGQQEDLYWRSAMSGGRATVALGKGKTLKSQSGDISCVHSYGHKLTERFYIECKHYKSLNFTGLLMGRGHLTDFWVEAEKQAKAYDKAALLIAKQNHQPVIICMDKNSLTSLMVNYWKWTVLVAPKLNLHIVLFDDFLANAVVPE